MVWCQQVWSQPLDVGEPPRFTAGGEIIVSFTAGTSLNAPAGDETSVAARIRCRKEALLRPDPFEVRLRGEVGVGINYRNDSIPSQAFQITDNDLNVIGMLVLPAGWEVDPYAALTVQSALLTSYAGKGEGRREIASAFDPVIALQSIGGTARIGSDTNWIDGRVGIALQEMSAAHNTDRTDDPETTEDVETFRLQSGIEISGDAQISIQKDAEYRGRIEMFGTFDELGRWVVETRQELICRLGRGLNFSWGLTLRHDRTESERIQLASRMDIGIRGEL